MSAEHANQGGRGSRGNRGGQHRNAGRPNGGGGGGGRGRGNPGGDRGRSGPREHRPAGRVSAARLAAYDVLRDVDEREAYANLALPARIREAGLNPRDAAFVTELVSGTLRGRGRYDRIIEIASSREMDRIDPRTRNVLRLGAHQLLAMRTADHAALNESVELQRLVANAAGAGFVNGVLRTISRSTDAEWNDRIEAEAPSADAALAARTSHPGWILRALRDALAAEGRADELDDLLAADNRAPRVSLALLPGSGIDVDTAEALGGEAGIAVAGPSPLGLELAGGDPGRAIDGLDLPEGTLRVQDQGSQLAALALLRASEIRAGEQWLDLCAGPGGKTAVLAAEAELMGAELRANEVAEHRAELVRRAVVASSDAVRVVSHDGREPEAFGDGGPANGGTRRYDRILVDAPCSGLGALRRRPEARWRKAPSDLPELTRLQAELLDAAADHLAKDGLLAYVTCSPHLAETRVVLDRLLSKRPELEELDTKAVLNRIAREPLDLAGDALSAQLWPHRNGTDAMFIALLRRRA
ncbi:MULTISPECIES: RsmB/NOP family class I SAM-dependent RNA methyltransferase [unclassified Leucobacter]|uniref:RsmB/NOP family class I SAM-dependent RNA methyltransferase n=1 Tax=unclassified Leucobacter TaxID=2621730 RepID=UPI000A07BE5D|nr:transcription antitermination factor NusB [Leucobacter sp. Ag1]